MNWKNLLIKKAIVGRIPFADGLRKIKRVLFGYPPNAGNMKLAIKNFERFKAAIEKAGVSIEGATILEIGSGWFPTLPILFLRAGAKKIVMTDLNLHMDNITFHETVAFLKKQFPEDNYIQNIGELSTLPIDYLAPFTISAIADGSLDIISSNNVLEHIPKNDLYRLFSALRPKLSKSGIMVHLIDHSDHFEHHDKSISKIQFLTWSEEKHALINYLIKDGENRMRHHEYHQIFSDAGFDMIDEQADIDEKTFNDASKLDLTYPYSKMSAEQLAVLTSIYTLKPS